MKKSRLLNFVFTLPIYLFCTAVNAELATDAFLNFDAGVPDPSGNTALPPLSGSYFAMQVSATTTVYTTLSQFDSIKLGDIQPASGSHSGLPDGTESPGIDNPWDFFGNTGMHETLSPLTIISDDNNGNVTLDFGGWGVEWNGIPNIPLGGSPQFPQDTGIATLICAASCEVGDDYVLDYSAHVPPGDPSGFGGVAYTLHLEGVISPGEPLSPTKQVFIQLTGGNSHECSSIEGDLIEATANIITTDTNDIVSVNWELDGTNVGSGNSIDVLTPLGPHTISVAVNTLASGIIQNSAQATVSDSTPPQLDILFIDQRSGIEITEVSGNGKSFITVRYDVTDACDQEPMATGVAVPVHAIDDGDTLKIQKSQLDTTALGTSAVNVSADATDASGNQRHREATLLIVD